MDDQGYVLIDAIFSFAIVMLLIFTLVPINSIITTESEVLSDRRLISSLLHDELQLYIVENQTIPYSYHKSYKNIVILYTFSIYDELFIKGCAVWENIKALQEEVCLYGKT